MPRRGSTAAASRFGFERNPLGSSHVLIRSNAAGINTRLHGADATKHRFAGLRYCRYILSPAKRYFVASSLISRAIHGMVLKQKPMQPMDDEADTTSGEGIWPPPPTFRPDVSKPARKLPPLWISLTINAAFALLFCVFRTWHLWQTHRKIDWFGDVASLGLMLFTMTTAAQIWVVPWVRRKTET